MYEIRKIKPNEVDEALSLVFDVFMEFEAPVYSNEGVKRFLADVIENKEFRDNCKLELYPMYGAFDKDRIIGVMGMRKNKTHINLAFIKKEYHNQGIAKAIFNFLLDDVLKENPTLKFITVNSSPYAVNFYHKIGFVNLDIEQEINGIKFTPMIILLDDDFKLIYPNESYIDDIFLYKNEFLENNDSMDGCGGLERYNSYEEWINHLSEYANRNKLTNLNFVEGSQYLFVRKSDNKIIGMVNFRHYLNDFLLKSGGHIGYSIRPSERKKGYGKKQLAMFLELCRQKNMEKLLLTCDVDNPASAKTIIANGGILENEIFSEEFNCLIQRYWIQLQEE